MRIMTTLATLATLVLGSTLAFADDKKEEEAKPEAAARCLIVKAGDKDVSPPVEVDYAAPAKGRKLTAATAEILCKSQATAPARDWGKSNGVCAKNMTFKFVVTYGTPGKEKSFTQNATCKK
jgi:hypothetical protein